MGGGGAASVPSVLPALPPHGAGAEEALPGLPGGDHRLPQSHCPALSLLRVSGGRGGGQRISEQWHSISWKRSPQPGLACPSWPHRVSGVGCSPRHPSVVPGEPDGPGLCLGRGRKSEGGVSPGADAEHGEKRGRGAEGQGPGGAGLEIGGPMARAWATGVRSPGLSAVTRSGCEWGARGSGEGWTLPGPPLAAAPPPPPQGRPLQVLRRLLEDAGRGCSKAGAPPLRACGPAAACSSPGPTSPWAGWS